MHGGTEQTAAWQPFVDRDLDFVGAKCPEPRAAAQDASECAQGELQRVRRRRRQQLATRAELERARGFDQFDMNILERHGSCVPGHPEGCRCPRGRYTTIVPHDLSSTQQQLREAQGGNAEALDALFARYLPRRASPS